MNALPFQLEHRLSIHLITLLLQGLVEVLRQVSGLLQVCSGGKVFSQARPGCNAAKLNRSLKEQNSASGHQSVDASPCVWVLGCDPIPSMNALMYAI